MNQWKSAYAVKTKARTLADALEGADAFFGLSAKGAVTQEMVQVDGGQADHLRHGQSRSRDHARGGRTRCAPDAIVATGRSDYPNQINNVLGFPFIFRGALDVQASTINEEMKIAAAKALAELAREDVPDQVAAAFHGRRPTFGPDYIIPGAVRSAPDHARAAGRRQGGDGNGRRAQADRRHGGLRRAARRAGSIRSPAGCSRSSRRCATTPKRIIFAEGEEPAVVRAANAYPQRRASASRC